MDDFVDKSSLYQLFLAERLEIQRHKWVLSERLGKDVGYDYAVISWIRNHKQLWWESQKKKLNDDNHHS